MCTSVMDRRSKSLTTAHKKFHGRQLVKCRSLDPLELVDS